MNQEQQGQQEPTDQGKPYDILPAAVADVAELAHLFDAYRVFYGADPDPIRADAFLHGLVTHAKTHFFLARETPAAANLPPNAPILGFVHLMPSIATVAMRPVWLLEDLYVIPAARQAGVATALLRHAEAFARETGAERLTLATAHDNRRAQSLYKQLGYVREDHFWYFHRTLD
jgi:ribosomal protein S18 acetylase RimI-like enzyme